MPRYIGKSSKAKEQGQGCFHKAIVLTPLMDFLLNVLELALKYLGG